MQGRVSVVVPTFNRAVLIGETLASLAALRWHDVEVIVVDDGSTDETRTVIKQIRSDGFRWPLDYIWQPNAGPAAARNAGRRRARGEYLYHLDSDDLVLQGAFETLIPAMERAGASYALGVVENTDLEGNRDPDMPFSNHRVIHGDILGSHWYTHAALYRREIIDRIHGYNEDLRRGEDTEFHFRILATAGWPASCDDIIASRRVHGHGHLSYGSTSRTEDIDAILTVYEHFIEACPAAFCTSRNASRVLGLGSESGLSGDKETKLRCCAILLRMAASRPPLRYLRVWPVLLKPNSARYFCGLRLGMSTAASIWRRMKSGKSTVPKPMR